MSKSSFDNSLVKTVSMFLQQYMKENSISILAADQCASILARNNVLPNTFGPKPGFYFRQMLRDGRDGLIDSVEGACQKRPNTKWEIIKTQKGSP